LYYIAAEIHPVSSCLKNNSVAATAIHKKSGTPMGNERTSWGLLHNKVAYPWIKS
jgi:hypothetical protein